MNEGNFSPEQHRPRERVTISGKEFETALVAHVINDTEDKSGWNDQAYLELRKADSPKAMLIFDKWIIEHLMPLRDWIRMNAEGRKQALYDWVEQHQPEGWDPKDPPLNEQTTEQVASPSFLQDLHYAVAEGLARDLILQERINNGLPRTISEQDIAEYLDNSPIMEMLGVYTAANTPLDTLYNTDLFFKYEFSIDGIELTVRLPIDITTNVEKKMEEGFATKVHSDYLLSFDMYDGNGVLKKISPEDIKLKGREIGHYLFRRMEETQRKRIKRIA
jgi:hypothetical protein